MSKVTDDFGYDGYDEDDVNELLTHARALEAMLTKHEWILDDHMGNGYCPECGSKMNGHSPDCELARLIE